MMLVIIETPRSKFMNSDSDLSLCTSTSELQLVSPKDMDST